MEKDRRRAWDGSERRACYFDAESFAKELAPHLANYLDAYQDAREQRRVDERYAYFGRQVFKRGLLLLGAGSLYVIGTRHKDLMAFIDLFLKLNGA